MPHPWAAARWGERGERGCLGWVGREEMGEKERKRKRDREIERERERERQSGRACVLLLLRHSNAASAEILALPL